MSDMLAVLCGVMVPSHSYCNLVSVRLSLCRCPTEGGTSVFKGYTQN